jgi:hypothetical protein
MSRYFYISILTFIFNTQCFALQTIQQANIDLITEFKKNRESTLVSSHAQVIENTFRDEEKIIDRLAKDHERKIMITAIFSSVVTRELLKQSDYPDFALLSVRNQKYTSHFKAVEALYKLTRGLAGQFREGGYQALNLSNLLPNSHKMQEWIGLTADTFLGWFCESIETLYDELSYFDHNSSSFSGKIDRNWFEGIQNQHKNNQASSFRHKHPRDKGDSIYIQILDNNGIPIAIYKPTSTNGLRSLGDRQSERECLTSLFAKVMGFSNVFNRVIPMRLKGRELIFDPINPTGTLERFLGFTKESCRVEVDDFSELLLNTCNDNSERPEKTNAKTFTLTHRDIVAMLVKEDSADHYKRHVACYTNEHIINRLDLLKVFTLWHLTLFRDLHHGNLLLVPDFSTQTLTPVAIDAEVTWGKSGEGQYPWIYKIDQAQEPFTSEDMLAILDYASPERIGNIFTAFSASLRDQKSALEKRLSALKELFKGNKTIAEMMNEIVYGKTPDYEEDKKRFTKPYNSSFSKFFNCIWNIPRTLVELQEKKWRAEGMKTPRCGLRQDILDSMAEDEEYYLPTFSLKDYYLTFE